MYKTQIRCIRHKFDVFDTTTMY